MGKFNLVLSGGGVRGYAHIGALKALFEMGVEIGAVSGGSSGAIVGALLCDGYSPEEIAEIIVKEEPRIGISWRHFKKGLLSFEKVRVLLKKYLRARNFSELKMPLFVGATSLETGLQEIFREGDLVTALAASSALPLLLAPVVINNIPYADAGMSNNLPVEPLLGLGEKIIGVHVNPILPFRDSGGLMETIDRSMHIIVGNNIRSSVSMCSVFIEPAELVNYHLLAHKKAAEIIEIGYRSVKDTVSRDQLV